MESKKPYSRSPPLRLKCVASACRPLAKAFHFGEAVEAEWTSLSQCVLTDGQALYLLTLPEGKEDRVVHNMTYVFKNLVLKESRAYYNDNTMSFKSYDMDVSPEIVDRATHLLLPPSTPVSTVDAKTSAAQYMTVVGQVTSVSIVA